MARAWIGGVALACLAVGSCSSSGPDPITGTDRTTTEVVSSTGIEAPIDIEALRSKLVGGDFTCDEAGPGEEGDPGLPPSLDQVLCSFEHTEVEVSRWASPDQADEIEADMRALMGPCDPEHLPVSYVDGGEWLAFTDPSQAATDRSDQVAAMSRTNEQIVELIGGKIVTPGGC